MQLRIFSELDNLTENFDYEPILFPFLENVVQKSDLYSNNIFNNYVLHQNSFFPTSSLKEADLIVLPINWEKALSIGLADKLIKMTQKAEEANTTSIGFFGGDCSHLKLEKENDLMFRHSLFASTQSTNDFAYPAWSEDILSEYLNGEIIIRKEKSVKPTVGFCGFSANKNFKTYLKLFLYRGEKYLINRQIPRYHIGHVLRSLVLSTLSKSSLLNSNFLIRNKSFFYSTTPNHILQKKQKDEFVQNIIDSDYIFCCRGSGNYSFRFYEALSCGRIPVFLNTDCVLPYDFEIDWKKYCVWVEEHELPIIDEKISEFHENISSKEFLELQYECRKIWQERISPEGFFGNLYRHIPLVRSSNKNCRS